VAPTEDLERTRSALAHLEGSGLTSLFDAAYAGLAIANASDRRGAVIVFTDGDDTSSWLSSRSAVDASKRSSVVFYAVGATEEADTRFLQQISDATGGRFFRANDRNLKDTFLTLLDDLKHRYLLTYYPTEETARSGWHTLTVRLKSGRGDVKARPGYYK
jgi:Ca-activated chloride channel homolog